jgi:thiol-disulfide isomerase/thioredoxin
VSVSPVLKLCSRQHRPHERSGLCRIALVNERSTKLRQFWLVLALAGAMAGSSADTRHEVQPVAQTAALPVEGNLPALEGAIQWINSPALSAGALRGKVVLVDFWTYTCINWRRTLPYVSAWAEKYKDHGLIVIGAHTPEFGFEKNLDNVHRAVDALAIRYPVAVDSNYRIWRAFSNQYWPAIYIADAQGRIRYHHFGEGAYEESEKVIQQLLAEAGNAAVPREPVSLDPRGSEAAADWATLKSPESYLGYEQAEFFASPGGAARDKSHVYAAPSLLRLNEWALVGDWTIGPEYAALNRAPGRIAYRFHARDVNLIMGPAVHGTPIKFRVLIDGKPPGTAHGVDVDEQGDGTLSEPRMYQLIRQPGLISDRLFEIEFVGAGAEAFDFTFG